MPRTKSDEVKPPQVSPIDEIRVAQRGNWTVLRLQAASMMDVRMIESLHGFVRNLLDQGHIRLVLDFKKVHYISSSMVGVLVAVQQDVVKKGPDGAGELILTALNDRLVELLRLTRLESMFVVEPDSRSALKKVGAIK